VVGRPPFDPALVLKAELISFLYNLSVRQVEVYINENLPAEYFVGLAGGSENAGHSVLIIFRERLLRRGKLILFEEMLAEIIQIEQQKGVQFGLIQIVDSVHSVANVNTAKKTQRQTKDKEPHDSNAP